MTRILIERNSPPPGGFSIYYVPWSRTRRKRTPLEEFVPGASRRVLFLPGSWSGNTGNGKPPRGGGFLSINFLRVSSMKSTTILSRFLIDDRRSTVILRRWIGIDRRYRPWPIDLVDKSELVDRCRYLEGVGTISHHTWDHDFLVDGCPEPFHTTYATISQWSFFSTSQENAAGLKGRAFEASHEEAPVQQFLHHWSSPSWNTLGSVSILLSVGVWFFLSCVLLCEKRLK